MKNRTTINKREISATLFKNYNGFITYIDTLTPEEYGYAYQEKWNAGQQLAHLVLCIKALLYVFKWDKVEIEQKFGLSKKTSRTYETLKRLYRDKLKEGGKAPDRYVPGTTFYEQKTVLTATLTEMLADLCSRIDTFTEKELDSLCIPHPVLGNLSMREMLYNTMYHAEHHHGLVHTYLKLGLKNEKNT
ncbi:MAG: DinB family protein [Bacteroidota bacterium]